MAISSAESRRCGQHAGAGGGGGSGGTIGDILAGLLAGDEQPVVDQSGDSADHSGGVGAGRHFAALYGIRNCYLWSFTPLPDGGTHVSNTEVFAGFPVAVLRPLVIRRWNRLFQAAVDGLIGQASAARSGSSR
jgi:hypothetical protein